MTDQIPQQPMPKKSLPAWAKVLIILFIAGVGFLVLAGVGLSILGSYLAGGGAEKMVEKGLEEAIERSLKESGQEGNIDIEFKAGEDGVVIKDSSGNQQFAVQTAGNMPQDFPKDVPVYSPSRVAASMTMGPMNMVTLETSASVADVSSFYAAKLTEAGWSKQFEGMAEGNQLSAIYQKGDQQLTLAITREAGDKTGIVLSYGNMQ